MAIETSCVGNILGPGLDPHVEGGNSGGDDPQGGDSQEYRQEFEEDRSTLGERVEVSAW